MAVASKNNKQGLEAGAGASAEEKENDMEPGNGIPSLFFPFSSSFELGLLLVLFLAV